MEDQPTSGAAPASHRTVPPAAIGHGGVTHDGAALLARILGFITVEIDLRSIEEDGIAAGIVVTYFTFLPSFIMIFLGAPLIETTHGNLKFTAPLTGITAAVVGVILNLAVFFAYHVLWPSGFGGGFEFLSAVIGGAAFIAIWRYKIGIIPVIAACGATGLLIALIKPLVT